MPPTIDFDQIKFLTSASGFQFISRCFCLLHVRAGRQSLAPSLKNDHSRHPSLVYRPGRPSSIQRSNARNAVEAYSKCGLLELAPRQTARRYCLLFRAR